MSETKKVIGIVGSCRKGGVVDTAVSAVLAAAAEKGAETEKIYLIDKDIKFCTNCRECMQTPGPVRGACVLEDEMESILQNIESTPSLVIGAPVNFGNITAVTRAFLERCVGYAYWPWEMEKPQIRDRSLKKKAVLVSASGAALRMGKMFREPMNALHTLTNLLGAHSIGNLWVDKVNREHMELTERQLKKAKKLGHKLVK